MARLRPWLAVIAAVALAGPLLARATAPPTPPPYFAAWRKAVSGGDAAALSSFYSTQPRLEVLVSTGAFDDIAREVKFWAQWSRAGLTLLGIDMIAARQAGPGLEQVFFQAALPVHTRSGPRTFYLFASQTWQHQAAGWRIISASRSDLSRLRQPDSLNANLFPPGADARRDITAALARARRRHTRVLLIFGANWCYDCHVLDLALRHSDLTPLLEANYEVVDVDVGEFNRNLDIAAQYGVPLAKGVPALAVLASDGRLLYSQKNGEFEAARALGPDDLVAFLTRWKAEAH